MAAVRFVEALAHRERVVANMDIAARQGVVVVAEVDDRHRRQAAAAAGEPPGLVRRARRGKINHRALRHDGGVSIEAADLLVEVKELIDADNARVQRSQAVLDAHIVERAQRKTGSGIATVDVHRVVIDCATYPAWIAHGIVASLAGYCGAARRAGLRVDPVRAAGDVRCCLVEQEPGDPPHLLCTPRHSCLAVEVCVEQPGVRNEVDRREADLGKRAARDDAVQKPRIVVGDLVLLVGAARAAEALRVGGQPIRLDEALLHHRHRLGRGEVVAVIAENVERGRSERVAV